MKPGDVVRLKSGGPAMTIERVGQAGDGQPAADCLWFEGTEVKRGTFLLTTLARDE